MFLEERQPVTHAVAAGAFVLPYPLSSLILPESSPRPSRPTRCFASMSSRHGCVRCSRRKADSNTSARINLRDLSQAESVRESSRMATSTPTF